MGRERRRVRGGEGSYLRPAGWPDQDEASQVPGVLGWDMAPVGEEAAGGLGPRRLSELQTGEEATIEGFDAGHGLVSRLSALGFTPRARVTMLQNFGNGPVIVKMREARIALGRGEAMKVRVNR